MIKRWFKMSLTGKIAVGMVLGLLVGLFMKPYFDPKDSESFLNYFIVAGLFDVGGKIFVATLKMLVVPLVVVSLVCGVASLGDPKKLGRVGGKTIGLYLFTTALALIIALILAVLLQPGKGIELAVALDFSPAPAPSIKDVIVGLVPSNPFAAMTSGNMLQVIVFSLLFGLALALIKPAHSEKLKVIFNDLNEVVLKMVLMLMEIAPYGVFCLTAKVFAEQGFGMVSELAKYFGVLTFALLIQLLIVYPVLLVSLSRLNPMQLFKKIRNPMLFAFSTSSSNATLPVTLEAMEIEAGVDTSIASFTIPLGATINMDGTAMMQGVATVFIANAYNVSLVFNDYVMVVVTATLASIGTAGVPGVGTIMLGMVLKQVGLPLEGIALILGVDRFLDMMRTTVNVVGDCFVTCIVAKSENALNLKVFNS